jgi:hypothetical protein
MSVPEDAALLCVDGYVRVYHGTGVRNDLRLGSLIAATQNPRGRNEGPLPDPARTTQ